MFSQFITEPKEEKTAKIVEEKIESEGNAIPVNESEPIVPVAQEIEEGQVTVESTIIEIDDENPKEEVEENKEAEQSPVKVTDADPVVDLDHTIDNQETSDNTGDNADEGEAGSSMFDGLAVDAEEETTAEQQEEEDPEVKRQQLLEEMNKELDAHEQQLKDLEAKLQDVCEREDYDAACILLKFNSRSTLQFSL